MLRYTLIALALSACTAGDNTLIVLFPDEPALERWLVRFETLQASAEPATVLTEALVQ